MNYELEIKNEYYYVTKVTLTHFVRFVASDLLSADNMFEYSSDHPKFTYAVPLNEVNTAENVKNMP